MSAPIKNEILSVINGEKAIRNVDLSSIPENFRILQCSMNGESEGIPDRDAHVAFPENAMNVEDVLSQHIRQAYGKTFSKEDLAGITDALKEVNTDSGSSLTVFIRNIRFTFWKESAAKALENYIIDNYAPFIFDYAVSGEVSDAEFISVLPKTISSAIMEKATARACAERMAVRAEQNIQMAEEAIRIPIDISCPFEITVNESCFYSGSDFMGNWHMYATQSLKPNDQEEFFHFLETAGEKGENAESRAFIEHLLEYADFKEKGVKKEVLEKSYEEKIQRLSAFFAKNPNLGYLPPWKRGVEFSRNETQKSVRIFLLYGSVKTTLYWQENTMTASVLGKGRINEKEFARLVLMKEFFEKNALYQSSEEKPSFAPGM